MMENIPVVILILQLFLVSGEQVRGEMPMDSVEECLDAAKQAMAIRRHKDQELQAVAAGCHLTVTDRPT